MIGKAIIKGEHIVGNKSFQFDATRLYFHGDKSPVADHTGAYCFAGHDVGEGEPLFNLGDVIGTERDENGQQKLVPLLSCERHGVPTRESLIGAYAKPEYVLETPLVFISELNK